MTAMDAEKSATSPWRKPEKILRSRRISARLSIARGSTYSASSAPNTQAEVCQP